MNRNPLPKPSRIRFCPAVSRDIPPSECATHRIARYQCPEGCVHHAFGSARYVDFLKIEGALDVKLVRRLRSDRVLRWRVEREFLGGSGLEDESSLAARAMRMIFVDRDDAGQSLVDRWLEDGAPELSSDERTLLGCRRQVRPSLLEIRRIFDDETWEAVDLLDADPRPLLFKDRGMAAAAVRFLSLWTWIYPAPFFWRPHGNASVVSGMGDLDPGEAMVEIVRHLGGPEAGKPARAWLTENFTRVEAAFTAVRAAGAEAMLASMQLEWCRAEYEFTGEPGEVKAALSSIEELYPEPPEPKERRRGIVATAAWVEGAHDTLPGLPESSGESLGRVLFKGAGCHLEAMGGSRMLRLRQRFEDRMRGLVRFRKESREDMRDKIGPPSAPYDRSLVPPALLRHPPRVQTIMSRVVIPAGTQPLEQLEAEVRRNIDREWLDSSIPALEGATPRQAASDPRLRSALLSLLKHRVRASDERWRTEGVYEDVTWMLEELGTTEILVDPPGTLSGKEARRRG
jgi:hypothetical protein